jgi:hypothetical protein
MVAAAVVLVMAVTNNRFITVNKMVMGTNAGLQRM